MGHNWEVKIPFLIYIDDAIIFSESLEEYLLHWNEVFKRLRDANVKLNPKKFSFYMYISVKTVKKRNAAVLIIKEYSMLVM